MAKEFTPDPKDLKTEKTDLTIENIEHHGGYRHPASYPKKPSKEMANNTMEDDDMGKKARSKAKVRMPDISNDLTSKDGSDGY